MIRVKPVAPDVKGTSGPAIGAPFVALTMPKLVRTMLRSFVNVPPT